MVRDYLLSHANYSARESPLNEYWETMDVLMTLKFHSMIELNEKDQYITTSAWVILVWEDHRLVWDPAEFGNVYSIEMNFDEVWSPKLFVTNALNYDGLTIFDSGRSSVIVSPHGWVTLSTPLILHTKCRISREYFPFDHQSCEVTVTPDSLRIRLSTAQGGAYLGNPEWALTNFTSTSYMFPIEDPLTGQVVANMSAAIFCLMIKRSPVHYIWNLIVPSTCLCLMALSTFLSPPDSGERLSLGVSMVLGLTVFQLLVADLVPIDGFQVPHLSTYLSVNFIMACLAVPISLWNINIVYGDTRMFLLKYAGPRNFFLETLPRVVCAPTYSARIRELTEDGSEGMDVGEGNRITPETTLSRDEEDTDRKDWVGVEKINSGLSKIEKMKMERRVVAVAMDRLFVTLFAFGFLLVSGSTAWRLQQNPGDSPYSERCDPSDPSSWL